MLHSEILPEHDCGGELIEAPEDEPTHVHFAQCARCGTELTFEPDSDWGDCRVSGCGGVIGAGFKPRSSWPVTRRSYIKRVNEKSVEAMGKFEAELRRPVQSAKGDFPRSSVDMPMPVSPLFAIRS